MPELSRKQWPLYSLEGVKEACRAFADAAGAFGAYAPAAFRPEAVAASFFQALGSSAWTATNEAAARALAAALWSAAVAADDAAVARSPKGLPVPVSFDGRPGRPWLAFGSGRSQVAIFQDGHYLTVSVGFVDGLDPADAADAWYSCVKRCEAGGLPDPHQFQFGREER